MSTSPSRSFTGALRKAIQVRDSRCTHPAGCDMPAEICDVDHITEHQHGGPTSLDNGRIHCPRHNRNPELRHQTPDGPRTTRPPRGWIPDTHPPPPRTSDPDDHGSP